MSGKSILNMLIVALLAVAGVVAIVSAQHPQEPVAGQSPSSPEASASTAPQPTKPTEPATELPAPSSDANNPYAAAPSDPFREWVLQYEELYRSPRTAERDALLAKYTTQAYLAARRPPSSSPDERGKDIIVRIDRNPAHTEVLVTPPNPAATTRYVSVRATASTLRPDGNGQEAVVFDNISFPDHATVWVLQQGTWRVDSER